VSGIPGNPEAPAPSRAGASGAPEGPRRDPRGGPVLPGATLVAMPYLEPNPPKPQKKLLLVFALMMAVPAAVAIIATIAARMG
jgi:hypothetical protein